MKRAAQILAITTLLAGVPSVAFAWDFSCSPKQTTEISRVDIPNIMVMLDKSGSMDDGDRTVTCRVCQEPDGTLVEVAGPADCQPSGTRWTRQLTLTQPTNSSVSGYQFNASFTSFPTPEVAVYLDVNLRGDYNGGCEYADIYIDGTYSGRINPNNGQCDRDHVRSFLVPAGALADGVVNVRIRTSPDNNGCGSDGVDAFCADNRAIVTLRHSPARYWGSQTWANPCGRENKWEQAVNALDRITYESSSLDPDLAAFGLAVFADNDADILMECKPDSHDTFMSLLNPLRPSGNTPTGEAINTAANSDCVAGSQVFRVSQEDSVPRNTTREGHEFTYDFTGLPPQTQDFQMEVGLFGDYNGSCEFADVYADGVLIGRHRPQATLCNTTPHNRIFTIPQASLDDGALKVTIHNRLTSEATTNPTCSSSSDGVDAYCTDNRGVVTLLLSPDVVRASATVLVNDGAPTAGFGGRGSYEAGIYEACQHRDVANLYVVGLGSGTDQDYNNILAAAGGSGTCTDAGVDVDPCDNVSNWANLRNKCTGAFQTDSSSALMSALAAITAELQCLYDVNFNSSGYGNVPPDPSNEYEYLAVEANWFATGPQLVFNENSTKANPLGEGWFFNNPNTRTRVQFSDFYCQQVNLGKVAQVSTQLACLCQEPAGAECDVPNNEALGVCPKGVWACAEGIDYCEPEANCCEPDLDCELDELLGECKFGKTICIGPTEECVQTVFPTVEICDGKDNDCDGIIDNIVGTCGNSGGVGRCAPGILKCDATGAEICISEFQPMPELCNGIDDDCNGIADDITASWDDPQFAGIQPPVTGPLCNYASTCMCPSGVSGTIEGETFDEFFAAWEPLCACGEGLEEANYSPAPSDTPSNTDASSEPRTGCSATGADGDASWVGLLLLGLFWRRRRKN